ncbi:MAG: LysM peptidoglycan-binding domain-containing protein [Chitinophagaceae bacterium]
MMKTFFSTILIFLSAQFISAQNRTLLIKNSDKGSYLEHKIVAKESFYSVGRLYNVHPKFIASFNKLDMNKGLSIDQKLNIPLTDTNFTQTGNTGTPVYYKTAEKEGLMKVSKANNNVLLTNLRGWNNLSSDEVKEGTKLIVGFLKSKEMPSITLTPTINKVEPDVKVEEKPPVVEPKVEEKPVVKTEEKPIVVTTPLPTTKPIDRITTTDQGFFKSHFEQQVKTSPITKDETVTAGIFKTISGWQDAKYYLLIDKVSPGTIVKIINPGNNKAVYAKVLGEMSGIRQNEGLNIRVSNATASVLEIKEQDKFILKLNY